MSNPDTTTQQQQQALVKAGAGLMGLGCLTLIALPFIAFAVILAAGAFSHYVLGN